MNNNLGVDESAGKLQTLEKIKNLIENGQGEIFGIYVARNLMPSDSDLDKLCSSYRRTWEENALASKNTPEVDLIIWSEEDSKEEMYLSS